MLNLHGFIGIASIDDNGDCDDFGLHLLLTTIVALFRAVSRVVVVIVDGDVCIFHLRYCCCVHWWLHATWECDWLLAVIYAAIGIFRASGFGRWLFPFC